MSWYRDVYLKSKEWSEIRSGAIKDQGKHCQLCFRPRSSSGRGLDVHHIDYKNLHDVTGRDLMVLCRECHDMIHRLIVSGFKMRSRAQLNEHLRMMCRDKTSYDGVMLKRRRAKGLKMFNKLKKEMRSWRPIHPPSRKKRFISAQERAEQIGSAIC